MTLYTFQVSNHKDAGKPIETEESGKSWQTLYDGPVASAEEARKAVDGLARLYRHARVFKGGRVLGKLHYAVLR
jgi:hypothetical protein